MRARAFFRLFWIKGAMHCSVPAGQLPSVRAVKPPPGADKPLHTARRSIVHTSRRSALAPKSSRAGAPWAWAYSKPAIYQSLHLSHRVIMPPGSSTNDDETQGYLSGAAARNQGAPCTPIPPRVAAALPQNGGHQERVLSSCYTFLCAVTRQIG